MKEAELRLVDFSTGDVEELLPEIEKSRPDLNAIAEEMERVAIVDALHQQSVCLFGGDVRIQMECRQLAFEFSLATLLADAASSARSCNLDDFRQTIAVVRAGLAQLEEAEARLAAEKADSSLRPRARP
jgi:hypothetical protein